jgi:hypothetical protein
MTDKKDTVGIGRFSNSSFQRKGQVHAERFLIRLPKEVVHSPDFPFKDEEYVVVKLEGRKLIISKLGE